MSNCINEVTLLGNITRDPELIYTASGTPLTKATIAVNELYKTNGESREQTEFINLILFGKQAEIFAQYVTKGRKVYVKGKLQNDNWTDKDGNKRYSYNVKVNNFEFWSDGRAGEPKAQEAEQQDPQQQDQHREENQVALDDVPF
jgi:single-strand DNA-binding protein